MCPNPNIPNIKLAVVDNCPYLMDPLPKPISKNLSKRAAAPATAVARQATLPQASAPSVSKDANGAVSGIASSGSSGSS